MAIGAVAGRQHGVISLAQLLELGLTRRAVEVRLRLGRLVQGSTAAFTQWDTSL